jgi:hypothetical protein
MIRLIGLVLLLWSSVSLALSDQEVVDLVEQRVQKYAVGVIEEYKSPQCSGGYAGFFLPAGIDYGVIAICANTRVPMQMVIRHELAHVAQWCAADKGAFEVLAGYLDDIGTAYAFMYPGMRRDTPEFLIEAQADTIMRTMNLEEVLQLVEAECDAYMERLLDQ